MSWGPSVLKGCNFLLGRGKLRLFSSMKPSQTNHVNSRIADIIKETY